MALWLFSDGKWLQSTGTESWRETRILKWKKTAQKCQSQVITYTIYIL